MSNQKKLEEYLVGANGYLKSDISNGKVIMLSGKWGSGKTHFWKNKIQTVLNDKDNKKPNHYISLYGKTSIQEIKNEVFLKIFESVDSSELEEKGINLAKNTVDLISLFTKSVGIDLSKLTDKPFENLEKIFENKKLKKTVEYLNSGAIICFDDFERKSKDIDLNDLFGFITNLTIEFKSKVVIILNDDVFEGEEKKIFSNVKEKSVSKFLKYEPSIKELFETIFSIEKYRVLDKHEQIILDTIEETEELNARIYIQVLDNLVEWIENKQEKNNDILRCLILVNINFILYHKIMKRLKKRIANTDSMKDVYIPVNISKNTNLFNICSELEEYDKIMLIDDLIFDISTEKTKEKGIDSSIKVINENKSDILASYFSCKYKIDKNVDDKTFQKINNFIETGILINE